MRVHLRLAWIGVLWLAACGGDSTGGGPPPPNSWVQRASVAGGGVSGASSFVIDGRIYIANGFRNGWTNLVYRYDPSRNSWEQFPSTFTDVRANGIGFSIGGFGYMGLGSNCLGGGLCTFTYFQDLWRLDPTTRLWTRMADFPGEARANAVVFVIGDKAYVTGGSSANQFDTWQYNTSNNTWTQKADFAGACNGRAVAFSIGSKGYVGLGRGLNGGCKDFWAYDTVADSWTRVDSLLGMPGDDAVGFSIGDTAFVVGGSTNPNSVTEVWTYSAAGNAWTKRQTIYPGIGIQQMIGAAAAGRIFVGLGTNNPVGAPTDDFWEYIK
jgi:N-acetylneuraminic acid mutarotase